MTIETFLAHFSLALTQVAAQPLVHTRGVYPNGALIRVQVTPPGRWYTIPPVLDPVGVVHYAKTGSYRSILEGLKMAIALGLSPDDALTLLEASDKAVADEPSPVAAVRRHLLAILHPWMDRCPPVI